MRTLSPLHPNPSARDRNLARLHASFRRSLRPVVAGIGDPGALPAGYRVTFERLRNGRVVTEVIGAKACQRSIAHQQAAKKSGFIRALKLEPLTTEQYQKEFPAGQAGRTGRFVLIRA